MKWHENLEKVKRWMREHGKIITFSRLKQKNYWLYQIQEIVNNHSIAAITPWLRKKDLEHFCNGFIRAIELREEMLSDRK